MAGGEDDREPGPPEVTAKTAAFVDELNRPDLWRQVTPFDPLDDLPPVIEAEFRPGEPDNEALAPAGVDEPSAVDSRVTESSATTSPMDVEEPAFTETAEAWEEAEEFLDGDGPFAVPVDAPPPRRGKRSPANHPAADLMADAFGASTGPAFSGRPGVPLSRSPRELNLGPDDPPRERPQGPRPAVEPHILQRRVVPPKPPPSPVSPPVASSALPERPRTVRRYPKMLALLKDTEVARRPGRIAPDLPPPVPGTFFPAPREPMEQPEPSDLDQMLLTMAEGLLIGETPDGHTEVRVTLKDEFFAGTELRIVVAEGKVRATLAPPDRDAYWQLNASVDVLKRRLQDRGLDVDDIEILDP